MPVWYHPAMHLLIKCNIEILDTHGSSPLCLLFRFSDFHQDVLSLYNLEFGDQMGKSTGWQSLDEVYRVSRLSFLLHTDSLPRPSAASSAMMLLP